MDPERWRRALDRLGPRSGGCTRGVLPGDDAKPGGFERGAVASAVSRKLMLAARAQGTG